MKTWKSTPEQDLCRDLLHAWKPYTARQVKGGYERELQCARCKTLKFQRLDRKGFVTLSRYHYPVGYLRPGGGRMSQDLRGSIRLDNVSRTEEL